MVFAWEIFKKQRNITKKPTSFLRRPRSIHLSKKDLLLVKDLWQRNPSKCLADTKKCYTCLLPVPAEEINASTSLGKRHFPGSMAKNSFVVPSRYKQIWIAPATRWIQRPPTPEPATSVFVLQPVHPSSPIPVVVAPPAPVLKNIKILIKKKNISEIVGTMSSTDLEVYRQPWETGPFWELKREFLKTYENDYPIDRLLCLAQAYSNMKLLHCSYPEPVIREVQNCSYNLKGNKRFLELHQNLEKRKNKKHELQAKNETQQNLKKGRKRNMNCKQIQVMNFHNALVCSMIINM
ncbi:uncharacterized protein NPIL_704681 [Nephila pilipes]|uniref:XRN2-binding (XTBD) domain-containing protein n=1 Tax=Nephila pilipes TaxID=299642 RepID=A0A8X6Q7F2_NEPPI|nr:uncharacterized protein NPIL_704681 [Nephila pilipes]